MDAKNLLAVCGLFAGLGAGPPAQLTAPPEVQDLTSPFDRELTHLDQKLAAAEARLTTLAHIPQEQTGERLGYHSRILQGRATELWVQVDLGASRSFESVVIVPVVLPREQGGIAGYGFPRRFQVTVDETPEFKAAQTVGDYTAADLPNPGRAPVVIHCPTARGRYLRLTATGPTGRVGSKGEVDWPSLALAEIMVLQGDRNLAAGRKVTAPTSREAAPVWSLQNLTDGESILGAPVAATTTTRKGWHSVAYPDASTPVAITLDLGRPLSVDDIRIFPMRWEGFPHWLGFGFPVRYKIESALDPSFADAHTLVDNTQSDLPNPGMNAAVVPVDGLQARMIRITATRLWERFTDYAMALSEVQVFSEGKNVAREAMVATTSTYPSQPWDSINLVDGDASDNPILPLPEWVNQLQLSSQLEKEIFALTELRRQRREAWNKLALRGTVALVTLALLTLTGFLVRTSLRRRRELRALQQRIARDLHDEVGSNLAGIALLSREAGQTASPPQRRQLLEEVSRVAEETAASMRDLVWMIQPGAPGDLVGGFRQCANRLLAGMPVEFHPPEETLSSRLPLDFKRQLYLIYKEALQNVTRHSQAKRVVISITREGRQMVVRVKDDGVGLSATPPTSRSGHGLDNMRERAATLRGEVKVHSPPEGGCEVEIRVPWP